MAGFFLPLSGGIDSASVALIVSSMCHMIVYAVGEDNDNQVLRDVRALTRLPNYTPTDPADLCEKVFVTAYMGTENSSEETQQRAVDLAGDIGSYHVNVSGGGL